MLSACAAFGGSRVSGSPWIGVLRAAATGAALALLHGLLCSLPRVNDVATGIALMLLGTGLAFYLGKPLIQPQAAQLAPIALGGWSESPVVQAALQINPLLPIGLLLAAAVMPDLRGRAGAGAPGGDSASATKALGYSVNGIPRRRHRGRRAIAGLGGASLTLFYPQLNEGISSGQGRSRSRLVIFARWNPLRRQRSAAVLACRRDRPGAAVDRHQQPGLLNLQRRALRADAGDLVISCRPERWLRQPASCRLHGEHHDAREETTFRRRRSYRWPWGPGDPSAEHGARRDRYADRLLPGPGGCRQDRLTSASRAAPIERSAARWRMRELGYHV